MKFEINTMSVVLEIFPHFQYNSRGIYPNFTATHAITSTYCNAYDFNY